MLDGNIKCKEFWYRESLMEHQYFAKAIMDPPRHLILLQFPPSKINLFLSFQITQRKSALINSHNLGSLYIMQAFIFHRF
jgi:hypothetical protein